MSRTAPALTYSVASSCDAEELVALRVAAMRESLERIGRFDRERARDRLLSSFSPQHTRHINANGRRVGFFVVKPHEQGLLLDHLYVHPNYQSQGIGAAALSFVQAEAKVQGCSVRVSALRGSASNRFYAKHGFVLVEQSEFDNYYVWRAANAL